MKYVSYLAICCVGAALVAGDGMTTEPVGRSQARGTVYEEIGCAEVTSAYKDAFIASGFIFVRKSSPYGTSSRRLEFEFPNPAHPRKQPGRAWFRLRPSPEIVSCSVVREVFGEGSDYTIEQWEALRSIMDSAQDRALEIIYKKLRKNVRRVEGIPTTIDEDGKLHRTYPREDGIKDTEKEK